MLAEARRGSPRLRGSKLTSLVRPPTPPNLIYTMRLAMGPDHEPCCPPLLTIAARRACWPCKFLGTSSRLDLGLKRSRHAKRMARQAGASLARAHSSSGNVLALALAACSQSDLVETVYLQVLDGKDPVVNFMRGRPSSFSLCSARNPTPRNYPLVC